MTLREKLIKSFMGVGAMYALGIPIGLLSTVILTRTLGPEAFGQYTFLMALLGLIMIPVAGGVPQLLTREVAAYTHEKKWSLYRGVVRAAHLWVLLISFLILIVYLVIVPVLDLLPKEGKWALLGVAMLLIPLQGLNAARNGTIKGLGFPAKAELPTMAIQPALLLTVFAILATVGQLNVHSALLAQLLVATITFIIASLLFFRVRPSITSNIHPSYRPGIWLTALLPFALISLVGSVSGQAAVVLLGVLGSDTAVGGLRVAERIAQFGAFSLILVNMVISPHIVKMYRQENYQRLQELSRKTARGAFLLALPIGLVLIVLGEHVIKILFGAEFSEIAYLPMVILVLAQLFNVALGSVDILLIMSGYEKLTLVGQVASLIATVVLALMLIPHYQQTGAALAAAGGLFVWNIMLGYSVYKKIGIRPGIF